MTGLPPTLIIGTGLIGASIGLSLRRVGVRPLLWDNRPQALAVAVRRGAGTALGPESPQLALVIVAVPPAVCPTVVCEALGRYPEAVVTDVASVKAPILAAVRRDAPDSAGRYLGSHPMAGREVSGPLSARADLFDDRAWVLCPHDQTSQRAASLLRELVTACRAVPIPLDPPSHDRAVALVSHAPQVLSSLLAAQLLDAAPEQVAIAGQGLRDMTRVAASDPGLWTEILAANATPVADVLAGICQGLERVVTALRGGQALPVTAALAAGNAGRERVPGKHGVAAGAVAVLPVLVADSPGELSRLFAAIEVAGVNVEDARIEHVLGRPTGVVEVTVAVAQGQPLANRLRSEGWSVRG